jgi:molybdopterin molybdotransferase
MLSYQQARETVISRIRAIPRTPATETVPLRESLHRILAQDIVSDREYPPFDRSIRDGYAVRAEDTHPGAQFNRIGELKAGDAPTISVAPGTCIQIMTGAPLPDGADAVIMIEHTSRDGDTITLDRAIKPGQHVVRRGSEQAAGRTVLNAGARLGFAVLAAAAQVGAANPIVTRKPHIAILSTGDEVVDFASTPGPFQIRNSNSVSLAAQVSLSGGEPTILGNASDSNEELRAKIAAGLEADMLILSGGVSMGKYDLVEPVLKEFGAEMIFDAVAIRPGKPVVFALCKGKPFEAHGKPVFGLPGNPVSTMVTFELFVRPAIELLSGATPSPLPFIEAILTQRLSEKPGLTHFLPAVLECGSPAAAFTTSSAAPRLEERKPGSSTPSTSSSPGAPTVSPIPWQGSGDVVAMARANCLLVVPPARETIEVGERVLVLPRGL